SNTRQKLNETYQKLDSELKQTRDKKQTAQGVLASEEMKQQDVVARLRQSTAQLEKLKEYERHDTELGRLRLELGRLPQDPASAVHLAREALDTLVLLAQTVPLLTRFQTRREELRQTQARAEASEKTKLQVQARGTQCAQAVEELKPKAEEAARVLQQVND